MDWRESCPERLQAGEVLAFGSFRADKAQFIGKPCFLDGEEAWLLSVESSRESWLWMAKPYEQTGPWPEAQQPTKRESLVRQWEVDSAPLAGLSAVTLNGQTFRLQGFSCRYTFEKEWDIWPDLYTRWLQKRGELPGSLAGRNLAYLKVGLEDRAIPFPIRQLSLSFAPPERKALLQLPFEVDRANPDTVLSFEVRNEKYHLYIRKVILSDLHELLQREGDMGDERRRDMVAQMLAEIPENEWDLILMYRLEGPKELLLEIYPRRELDEPEKFHSGTFIGTVVSRDEAEELRPVRAGKVYLPLPDKLELELFSVFWKEEAPPDQVVL